MRPQVFQDEFVLTTLKKIRINLGENFNFREKKCPRSVRRLQQIAHSLSLPLSLFLSLFETGNQNCRIANAVRIVFTLNFCKVPQDRENEKDGVTEKERERGKTSKDNLWIVLRRKMLLFEPQEAEAEAGQD